ILSDVLSLIALSSSQSFNFFPLSHHVPLHFMYNPSLSKSQFSTQLLGRTNVTPNIFAIQFYLLLSISTMFPHRNIHKFTWVSLDGKIHNKINNILIDKKRNSSILDVQSFRAADCDTDHYLVVAKVRERLAVSKQTMHRIYMERFNLKKLNEVEGKEQYCVEISNRFVALENLDTEVDVNKACKTIRDNIRISAKESLGCYELKKHKLCFDEGCSELLDQRKSKEVGLGVKTEKTKYMLMSCYQNAGQNHAIMIGNRCFENVAQFRHLGTITNQSLIQKEIKRRLNSGNACYHLVQKNS
ncbi:hypothetical protein B7P43_G11837, partial [Cryptotermes secundus]